MPENTNEIFPAFSQSVAGQFLGWPLSQDCSVVVKIIANKIKSATNKPTMELRKKPSYQVCRKYKFRAKVIKADTIKDMGVMTTKPIKIKNQVASLAIIIFISCWILTS